MVCETCAFTTPRLLVKEWHSLTSEDCVEQELSTVVAGMLTESVTRSLPPDWHGVYSKERARLWIEERDREGTTLLVVEQPEAKPVGLVILYESTEENTCVVKLRLGYLLAEQAWGRGLATELLRGFVEWCGRSGIASVVGGVERDNVASQRVLENAGFVCDLGSDEVGSEELLYRLEFVS